MSAKNMLIFLFLLVVLGIGAYLWNSEKQSFPPANEAESQTGSWDGKDQNADASAKTIEITANGYSESAVRVKVGDTVTWVNKDSSPHWPATAAHPTHTVYPGSDISKCGTPEAASIFDACKGLAPGESYSFKFDQKGDWKYHDHLKPVAPFFGSVTVE